MSFHNDAIFWVDTGKISPNPFQPRRDFDEGKLQDLADSIRQYGVLMPLVVTRKEVFGEDGGMRVEYELIAGERRLRASKIAGVAQVPVVIRTDEEDENVKLELAIIENLQREDLNPMDRAQAFSRLVAEFGYKHGHVAKKIGRSREYVSNSIRLLQLPEEMSAALAGGRMTEGHSRPLLMLSDRPEEQRTLFKEIIFKKLTVRDAEHISRGIATDRIRKTELMPRPELIQLEEEASESLGTRVQIKEKNDGGRITIDFSSKENLEDIIDLLKAKREDELKEAVESMDELPREEPGVKEASMEDESGMYEEPKSPERKQAGEEDEADDPDIYSISNFSV